MASRNFGDDGSDLWQMVTKGVQPLKNKKPLRRAAANGDLNRKKQVIIINQPAPVVIPPILKQMKESFFEAGDMSRVDGSIAEKLRDGSYPIDATLDLHGRTQDEAFESLRYFLTTAYSMGKRCILVITGKGQDGQGVLRENLPKWLNNNGLCEYILAYTNAKPQHGGSGAFYVLLRKNK